MSGEGQFIDQSLSCGGREFSGTAVSMGNPHLIIFEPFTEEEMDRLGPVIHAHEIFPRRTNVEFVKSLDGILEVKVLERGAGWTMACGTGACATAVAAALLGQGPVRRGGRGQPSRRQPLDNGLQGPVQGDHAWSGGTGVRRSDVRCEMGFEYANRLKKHPSISLRGDRGEGQDKKKAEGVDIIDFGIGDPDLPTPSPIVEVIKKQLDDPDNHRYPSSGGEPDARQAVAAGTRSASAWTLDPNGEVAILIGSKEGLANICRAFVNPGEKVLCPDPAYPVYAQGAALLCDAVPVRFPLWARRKASCPTWNPCRPTPG